MACSIDFHLMSERFHKNVEVVCVCVCPCVSEDVNVSLSERAELCSTKEQSSTIRMGDDQPEF